MKRVIFSLTFLFLLILTSILIYCNNNFLLLWNANTIKVEAKNPLSNKNIKIFQDNQLIYDGGGGNIQKIENYYGENDFTVLYDNKYKLKFRHFKTNRRHQHTYKFYFFEAKENICVHIKIKGWDDEEFEGTLSKL